MKVSLPRFCRALVVATAFLFTIEPAFSQTNVVFDIETNLTSFSVIQSIALPGNKIAVLGWENGSVALKVYSSAGVLSASINVDSRFIWQHTTHGAVSFTTTAMANGNIFIAYGASSNSLGISSYNARFVILNQAGASQASGQLNSVDAGSSYTSGILLDKLTDGKIVAVWRRGTNDNIVYRIFNADGSAFCNDQAIAGAGTSTPLSSIYTVKLAAGRTGNFMVSLYSWNSYFRAFIYSNNAVNAVAGGALSVAVDPSLINNYGNCGIAALSNGNFALCWYLNGNCYYKILAADGTTLLAATSCGTSAIQQIFPVNTLGSEGFILTAYVSANDYTGLFSSLALRTYNLSGTFQASTPLQEGFLIQPSYKFLSGASGGYVYLYSYYKDYYYDEFDFGFGFPIGDQDTKAVAVAFTVSTLPVALKTFTATLLSNKQVRLNWSTASEINNARFEIEKSSDAVNFTAIAEVKANGTIDRISEYSFTDTKTLDGTAYYRLRQVDIDGHNKDLGVRMVKSGTANSKVTVFPNPIQGATITINAGGHSLPFEWEMMDAKGQRLKSGKMEQQQVEIGVADLSKGIYFLRIGKEEVIKIRK